MSGLLPTPRKPSSNLFRPFRALGASGTPAKFAGYGFLRYLSSFLAPAGAVRDVCPVCRVRARCLACFRPLGNLQRRVLTLPRPRKRSAARFDAFRGLGNLQRRVLTLSEASETFSGAFWYFPRPRGRQGRLPSLPGTGFLRYPASFPAPTGDRATVCLQPPLATRELTTAKPPNLLLMKIRGLLTLSE